MIIILLSTYNGGRFLSEQLTSFEQQTFQDWRLIWRDDGSTDDTVAIMEEFSATTQRCTRVIEPVERLGPTASFFLLLRAASQILSHDDIVMFSDQDDVWLPEKMAKAKKAISSNLKRDCPALYFARQRLVDAERYYIGDLERIRFLPSFPDCLAQNVAAGCTMALNQAAVNLINIAHQPKNTYHDWWSYIIVAACGGRCIYDDTTVILYRQHAHNVVGTQKNFIKRGVEALRRGPSRFVNLFKSHIETLTLNEEILEKDARDFVLCVKNSLKKRWCCSFNILKYNVKRQNSIETLLFYTWILLG